MINGRAIASVKNTDGCTRGCTSSARVVLTLITSSVHGASVSSVGQSAFEICAIENASAIGTRNSVNSVLRPRGHDIPDVGERVAERADLPVEHRSHLSLVAHDAVPEPEVTVHDGGLALLGDAVREQRVRACDGLVVTRAAVLVLRV